MSKELVKQGANLPAEEQPVRIINVWNQKDRSQQEVHTAARTWGELKHELEDEIDFHNIRGVVRHNKNILEVDDAILPEESFSMFLFPQKVKSGMARTREEYLKTFKTAKDLRAECVRRGLGSKGNKEDFLKRLLDADKKANDERPVTIKPPIKSKAVTKAPSTAAVVAKAEESSPFPAVIESAEVTTRMTLQITDKNALSSLLEVQFPGMNVVSIKAKIDLEATLSFGGVVVTPVQDKEAKAPVEDKVEDAKIEEKAEVKVTKKPAQKLPPSLAETKKKKKVHEVPTKEQLKAEAERIAKEFL